MMVPAESPTDLSWHGDARSIVDAVLSDAVSRGASDIHIEPVEDGYEVRYRIDGLLRPVASYDTNAGRAVVGRLMVLANLLTYRVDLPQEGRLTFAVTNDRPLDFRLAIMPTAKGFGRRFGCRPNSCSRALLKNWVCRRK